jgi:hypothetical protein
MNSKYTIRLPLISVDLFRISERGGILLISILAERPGKIQKGLLFIIPDAYGITSYEYIRIHTKNAEQQKTIPIPPEGDVPGSRVRTSDTIPIPPVPYEDTPYLQVLQIKMLLSLFGENDIFYV